METGTVVSWSKVEGDEVNEGDLLAEIETDKATMSFDVSDAGFLAKILAPAGTKDIPVGTPLCIIVEDAGSVSAFQDFSPSASEGTPTSKSAPKSTPKPTPSVPSTQARPAASTPVSPSSAAPVSSISTGQRIFVSPLARRVAAEKGIDINQLAATTQGTGLRGMFRAADISSIQSSARPLPAVGSFSDVISSGDRSRVAQRSLETQLSVPHYYLTVDIVVDEALQLRDNVNRILEKRAGKVPESELLKISLNDIVIKAVAATCSKVPECNASWQGESIRQFNTVDINIAIPTADGLVMPVVPSIETKGLLQISQDVSAMANKARENKLSPQENQTGTFTVSNLGMFGITSFSTFINPPQACLLAVGKTQEQICPDSSSPNGFKLKRVISVTLCCDHRVVDGAVGASWLAEFKSILETPDLMLM